MQLYICPIIQRTPSEMSSSSIQTQPENNNHVSIHTSEPRWFAVRTRSKSEKYVCTLLTRKGLNAYIPVQRLMKRYTRSTRMTEKPLINSYVFVKIVKSEYLSVLETEHVVGFVHFNRALIAIPEAEIDILRRFTLEPGLDIQTFDGKLEVGDAVRVSAGSMMGMEGRIAEIKGKKYFQVELLHMGKIFSIAIDKNFLDKVGYIG